VRRKVTRRLSGAATKTVRKTNISLLFLDGAPGNRVFPSNPTLSLSSLDRGCAEFVSPEIEASAFIY